jgi:hypothetical protein
MSTVKKVLGHFVGEKSTGKCCDPYAMVDKTATTKKIVNNIVSEEDD